MADPRFFRSQGPFTLDALATLTGAQAVLPKVGSLPSAFTDVAPLDRAVATDVSFLDNSKYTDAFAVSQAGACFVREKYQSKAPTGMALLVIEDPYRAFALAAQAFYPLVQPRAEISSRAIIDSTARIGEGCQIGPGAVVGARAVIGARCFIGPYAVIGEGVEIGDESSIGSHCGITHTLIGKRVIIHRGVQIGQDGFGFAMGRGGHVKVPQLGRVVIENDVEIGAGTCIDRGAGPDTFIGEGTKIDNLVQIGHNVHIGRHVVIVAQTGIAGSTRIGDGAVLGGQVGITGHAKIGAGVRLAAKSGVISDVPPGVSWGGYPAQPLKEWHRQSIALARLAKKKGTDHD